MRIGELAARVRTNPSSGLDLDFTVGVILLALAALSVSMTRSAIRYEKRVAALAEHNKHAEARAELSQLGEHLQRYYKDFGYYPTTDQGLDFLLGSEEIDAGIFRGNAPHIRLLCDPWGHPFVYESDGNSYLLKSLGPGGRGTDPTLTVTAGR